jgi:hypothetical protein
MSNLIINLFLFVFIIAHRSCSSSVPFPLQSSPWMIQMCVALYESIWAMTTASELVVLHVKAAFPP